jgi:hypothetical protein
MRSNLREDGESVGFLGFREEGEGDLNCLPALRRSVVLDGAVGEGADGGIGAVEPGGADAEVFHPLLGGRAAAVGLREDEGVRKHGAGGMSRVRPGHDAVGETEVVEAGGHGTVDADADAEVVGGAARDAVVARLEAVDAAEGGGDADGAAAVGAQGDGDEARGHGVGGAAGGAARVVGWVVGVEGRAGVGVVVGGVWGWGD